MSRRMQSTKMLLRVFAVMSSLGAWAPAADKTLIDYFLPMPIRGRMARDVWEMEESPDLPSELA